MLISVERRNLVFFSKRNTMNEKQKCLHLHLHVLISKQHGNVILVGLLLLFAYQHSWALGTSWDRSSCSWCKESSFFVPDAFIFAVQRYLDTLFGYGPLRLVPYVICGVSNDL